MTNETMANSAQQDIVISRLVRAPRAALRKAWSDPQLLIDQLEAFVQQAR